MCGFLSGGPKNEESMESFQKSNVKIQKKIFCFCFHYKTMKILFIFQKKTIHFYSKIHENVESAVFTKILL